MKRIYLSLLVAGVVALGAGACGEGPTKVNDGSAQLAAPPDGDSILRGDVGDFVWCDLNDNGAQDDGPDSGVNGVAVVIECIRDLDGSPWTMTLTTANDPVTGLPGWYNFNSVPAGSCMAYIDPATVPAGKSISTNACGGPLEFYIGAGTTGNNNQNVDFCLVEDVPPPPEDCCESGTRPDDVTFMYVQEDCSHTNNSQAVDKQSCDDYGTLTPDVYIKVTDKDVLGHHKEKVFFEGPVHVGGTFTESAAFAGASRIPGDTRIWVLDATGTTVLQKVKLHTSCSQPLISGEQFGSLVLVGCGQ